jgi:hypothetical protein
MDAMNASSSNFILNFPQKEKTSSKTKNPSGIKIGSTTNIPLTNLSTSPSEINIEDNKTQLSLAAEEILDTNRQNELKKQVKGKARSRGGKGSAISPDANSKRSLKKALPNAAVHNARDLHFKDFINQVDPQTASSKHILIGQIQGLLAGGNSKTDLNEISKALSNLQTVHTSNSTTGTLSECASFYTEGGQGSTLTNSLLTSTSINPTTVAPTQTQTSPLQDKSAEIINSLTPQQQMLLLQLVSQHKPVFSNPTSASTVLSGAVHQQALVQGNQQPSKILISSTPTIPTLALQKSQQLTNSTTGTVQIRGVVSMPARTQVSPIGITTHAIPVQYVVSPDGCHVVSPTGFAIQQQPIVQYVTASAPTLVYPVAHKSKPSTTGYVRIAPAAAVPTIAAETVNPLEVEKQKQKRVVLESMEEHLSEKKLNTQKVYETLPGATEFLSNVASSQSEHLKCVEEGTDIPVPCADNKNTSPVNEPSLKLTYTSKLLYKA